MTMKLFYRTCQPFARLRGVAVATTSLLALTLAGCGGGDSDAPSVTQSVGYTGTYSGVINRATDGSAANAFLPTGTITVTAAEAGTLTADFSVSDVTRATRAVTTYGPITGTYDSNGNFDLSGTAREYNDRTGTVTVGQQTVRLQGQLPSGDGTTSLTLQVGEKTATGTITQTPVGTPSTTPTPTPTPTAPPTSEGPPAPPAAL